MRRTTLACALLLAAAASHAETLHLRLGSVAVPIDLPASKADARLTLAGPDGQVIEREFSAGETSWSVAIASAVDGVYRYRVQYHAPANGKGTVAAEGRVLAPIALPAALEGSFSLRGGMVYSGSDLVEPRAKTQSIPDDLSVIGSACIGLDCTAAENPSTTMLLKENSVRVLFDDTSTSAGFPARDWQLVANDSSAGGMDRFSIEDVTGSHTPFTIVGNAPTHSIFVDSAGRVGLRTATPALDIHVVKGDTPAMRLEQSNSSGFTPQTWDVAGNEANFFVRDVTAGSRVPFRIRPGAPTSSIDIGANGNVGVGTAAPQARLDVALIVPLSASVPAFRVSNSDGSTNGLNDRFVVDSSGNVTARGTIAQLSSRAAKENIVDVADARLLARLEKLPVPSWNYIGAPGDERHIGPLAEDFHAAFDVGGDPRYLAPADVAGVALASVKALQAAVRERDERIAELEARLARIEAALAERQ